MRHFIQFLLALDQIFNVLIGSGWADETLSAYAHRKRGWRRRVINAIFFWQDDHCEISYLAEVNRKQMPSEYRVSTLSDQ